MPSALNSPEPLDPVEECLRELVRPAARAKPLQAARPSAKPRYEWMASAWPLAAAAMVGLACLLFVTLMRPAQTARHTPLPTPEPRHLTGGDGKTTPRPTTPPADDPLAPYIAALKDLSNEEYQVRQKAQETLANAPYEMIGPFKAWAEKANDPEVRAGLEQVVKKIEMRSFLNNYDLNLGQRFFAHRTGEARAKALARYGGTKETEASVERALSALASRQREDGLWGDKPDYQAATTGLVLLAFMSSGHTETEGAYAKTVKRGVEALVKLQQPTGFFEKTMYQHGIATWALAEAAGMSKQPATVAAAQKAVDLTVDVQHEANGWRYQPRRGDGDLSISTWNALALFTARQAGLKVPDTSFDGIQKVIRSCQTNQGRFAYSMGGPATYSTTMCGNAMRPFFKDRPDLWSESLKWAQDECKLLNPQGSEQWYFYSIFWGTMASFQQGGAAWKRWNTAMIGYVLEGEEKEGAEKGTYKLSSSFDEILGREGTTAMAVLCLEAYYRYPRMADR